MGFKNLMIIKALVCPVFGSLLLAISDMLISLFGAVLGDGGIFTAREYGSSLIGNLFLCWFARASMDSDARRAIILALFTYDCIAFIMTVIIVLAGVLNLLGWSVAAIYLFFTIGFGYFLVRTPAVQPA